MDFHGMKRKNLQALCKKHGIPADLKNIEMAARLSSVFEKETEETLTDSISLSEDSLECDGIKDDLVVSSKEAKKVRFSPENEVFEFTRSVKKCQRKNVTTRSKGPVQQSGIELRRSKRILAKGKTIAGSNQNTRRGRCPDVTKALKLPRRIGSTASSQQDSKVTGLMVLEQFEFEDVSNGLSGSDQVGFKLEKTGRRSIRLASKSGALLPVQRSKRLADIEDKEEKLVKNNVKEVVSMVSEFHDTEKYHRKDVQDEHKVEKVPRRSGRFVNDIDVQTNTQDRRRSIRLKARAANTSMGGETSDGRRLFSAKESKEERKTKQTKGSTVVNSQERELVKNKTKEPLIDCKVQTTENFPSMKVQDVSKVEKVPRRSKRHGNDINVLLHKRHEKVVKRDDWGVEKAPIVIEGNLVQKKTDETLEKKRDRSAEPGMSQSAQFEQEEAGVANVESRGSSKKLKKMNQECAKDKPQGMIEKSPSSSETKAAESVMITENVLDSPPKKSVDSSQRTNTQELNSQLMEGNQDSVLMAAIEDNSFAPSVQFAVSNPKDELVVPTEEKSKYRALVKDIAEENTKTKEEILIFTPISELKDHSSVEGIYEKGSLGKEVQTANNFSEHNTENNSAVKEMEITKVGCVSVGQCVNLTLQELLDEYTQLEPEEGGGANVEAKSSSKKMKTVNQEFEKDKPQGLRDEDSPPTSETKATEPVVISENALDSTLKVSGDISPVRKTQELDSEILQGEREEKLEQDTFPMAEIKEREEASSLAVFLIKGSEVSNPEVELSVETTPPPASVQLAVSNPAAELGMPASHILVKDIVSTDIAKEGIHITVPRSELKEHSFVAKLAEAEANLENSAECWNEIQSSKDSEKGSLEKTIQAENLHGNFSEYSTENSKVGCISVGHCVNLEKLDEVKAESLDKSEQRSSCERGCKLNALELRRCSSTHFTSHSLKENNVKCSEVDEIKALSLPLPRNNDASAFDELAIFTTPEKKLMLMEQFSEKGKTFAIDSVTHHNDAEVQSHAVAFTTPKQVSSLGDAVIDEAGKEDEHTSTEFPDVISTTERYLMLGGSKQTEARNEGESIVVELHDESDIATSPELQFSVGDSKGERSGRNEDNRTAENYVSDGAKISGGNKGMTFYEESVVFSGPEGDLVGSFGQDKAIESEGKKVVQFYEECGLSTGLHSDQPLADSELSETGWQGINSADKSGLFTSVERQLLCGASEQKEAVKTGEKAGAEFNAGQETAGAELMPKDSQAKVAVGLDAASQGTSKKTREHSPHVDSVNLFDFDIEEAETILEAERNVSLRSNVLALPAKGNSGNYLEVVGTCSMVSEECGPSTANQNQINDVLEITDNNEADEHIEAKNIQMGFEENLLLNSSSGSYVSGKTCILAGTENEDEVGVPIATALEKAISLTSDELTVQNHMNEKDEEMITKVTTPISEETMNSSPENRKEYLNNDESGTLSKRQARRETILITRTQVKPTRHDMKENAPNSKIVQNLNVTAPRTSKRKPLQDLSKN